MNKLKTGLLILFAVIIAILIFFLVKNSNNNNNSENNSKMISEIKYMDNELTALLNSVNNISLENYKVSITKTSTNSGKQDNTASDQDTSGGSQKSNSSNSSSSSLNDQSTNATSEQYALKEEGVLTGNSETDWESIKNEVEILYTTIPTITLDLYNMNVNQNEILNFNKELDQLTIAIKEENKEKTSTMIANLYRYLPAYAKSLSSDSEYVSMLETKSNIFNSYVYANVGNWQETSNYTKKAIESYSAILNNINNKTNEYDTNKIYIILNELQNSASIQDIDVFTIKYKTFLEETEKIVK